MASRSAARRSRCEVPTGTSRGPSGYSIWKSRAEMADTIRERCLKRLFATLSAIIGVPSLVVERNLDAPPETFPIINLADGGQDMRSETGLQRNVARAAIEIYVDAGSSAALSTDFDVVWPKISQVLAADTGLGGVAVDVRETG